MARKTKRDRKRVIEPSDCHLYSQQVDGSGLMLTVWTKSGYRYAVKLSGLSPSKLVWMIERLAARAAYLLKVERDGQVMLERRTQAAAKRVSDATRGGA